MSRANPSDSHDKEAALYDQYVSERGCYGNEALFGLMYEFVKPGETVLDMGIGTGLSSILLHRMGLRVSGFDSSRGMLDVCKRSVICAGRVSAVGVDEQRSAGSGS